MQLKNIDDTADFLAAVDRCKGTVSLRSPYGDYYNLKSKLSQYIAIAALLNQHGRELELFCDVKEDETIMLNFFTHHPETL